MAKPKTPKTFIPADVVSDKGYEGMRPKLSYRKITGGSIPMFGMLIKPGQYIQAYPEEIAKYAQHFLCVDSEYIQKLAVIKVSEEDVVEEVISETGVSSKRTVRITRNAPTLENLYEIVPSSEEGFYNVINTTNKKVLNEKPVTKEEAENLQNVLNM